MSKASTHSEEGGAAAPAPAKGSMLGKLLVLGLVVVVVAVECVVAYLCIPTGSESTAAAKPPAEHKKSEGEAKKSGGGHGGGNGKADEAEHGGEGTSENVEIDLKEFSVTIFQPASNSTLRIDFHLWASVARENEKEFKRLFEENQARFREQVNMSVRSVDMNDLIDPGLGLLKRTILTKTRQVLGKPILQEVFITEYSTLEN
jgi:hypothetical protein